MKKGNHHLMLYNIKVILLGGKQFYSSSFFKSKVGWRINIENYIMYNSSVEIAVVSQILYIKCASDSYRDGNYYEEDNSAIYFYKKKERCV